MKTYYLIIKLKISIKPIVPFARFTLLIWTSMKLFFLFTYKRFFLFNITWFCMRIEFRSFVCTNPSAIRLTAVVYSTPPCKIPCFSPSFFRMKFSFRTVHLKPEGTRVLLSSAVRYINRCLWRIDVVFDGFLSVSAYLWNASRV